MQHTDKYKFNLIETSDTFSPDALNANAEAVEAELAALAQATAAADAALAQTDADNKAELLTAIGSGGKTCRIAWGSYVGDGTYGEKKPTSIALDFKPLAVFIGTTYAQTTYNIFLRSNLIAFWTATSVVWEDRAVSWYHYSASTQMNLLDTTYYYVVIGEDG